jgi:beta-lactamase superfamily II metal-dependent hydrolase
LIDAGCPTFPENMDLVTGRIISRYLWNQRINQLEYLLLTHPDVDHIGSFPFISKIFRPKTLLYSRIHSSYGITGQPIGNGYGFIKEGVWHQILHPDLDKHNNLKDNEFSLVMQIRFGRFSALFTGDITNKIEAELLSLLQPVVLLKVPHHGSRSSTSKKLLETTTPKIAWISAGRRNPFRHPSKEVLGRLDQAKICTFCTSKSGSLRIRTNGLNWRVQTYSTEKKDFIDLLSDEPLPLPERVGHMDFMP